MTATLVPVHADLSPDVTPVAILESAEWVVQEFGDDLFDPNVAGDEGLRADWHNAAIPIVKRKIQEFWMASGHPVLHVDSATYYRITKRIDDGEFPQDFTDLITEGEGVAIRIHVPTAAEAHDNWKTIIDNINPDDIAANL